MSDWRAARAIKDDNSVLDDRSGTQTKHDASLDHPSTVTSCLPVVVYAATAICLICGCRAKTCTHIARLVDERRVLRQQNSMHPVDESPPSRIDLLDRARIRITPYRTSRNVSVDNPPSL
jgi:hypothetical protein